MFTGGVSVNSLITLIDYVDITLQPYLDIESVKHSDPIVVKHIPSPWIFLGNGNYAAVVTHPDFPEYVVKIYAPGRLGIEDEVEVYNRIKSHPSFSRCFYHSKNYLILKKLDGETLYSCINKGIQIPEQVINDIDKALEYARSLELHPHDVHAKNVMMVKGRGVVVDISDFKKLEKCFLWEDFKKAYYKIYLSFFYRIHPPIPKFCLNIIRKMYRFFKGNISFYSI